MRISGGYVSEDPLAGQPLASSSHFVLSTLVLEVFHTDGALSKLTNTFLLKSG